MARRFLTPDSYMMEQPGKIARSPWEGGLYGYALNNPVNYIDPEGEFFFTAVIVAAAVGAVISGVQAASAGGSFGQVMTAALGGAATGAVVSAATMLGAGALIYAGSAIAVAAGGTAFGALSGGAMALGAIGGAAASTGVAYAMGARGTGLVLAGIGGAMGGLGVGAAGGLKFGFKMTGWDSAGSVADSKNSAVRGASGQIPEFSGKAIIEKANAGVDLLQNQTDKLFDSATKSIMDFADKLKEAMKAPPPPPTPVGPSLRRP